MTMRFRRPLLFGLITALFSMMALAPGCGPKTARTDHRGVEGTLKDIRFFAYQIQSQEEGDNVRKLADSRYDMLVIDQARSLKGEEGYESAADVARLKSSMGSSGRKKVVVCYLDVGEAESYRRYWQDTWRVGDPEWIVAPDPDGWDGNYPVKFWRPEWKRIMNEAMDRIIEDGYDGIYLDWLEVYSFEQVARTAREEGLDPRAELVKFVRELARRARSKKPGFLLIAQNAAELGSVPEYVELFDAVAQEGIFYEGAGDPDTGEIMGDVHRAPEDTGELLRDLALWQERGKPVFDVEYAQQPSNVRRAYTLGEEHGFKTYVTLRMLDALSQTPPPGY